MNFALSLFALLQAIGAIIGAGGVVISELFYFRAIRDGRIDTAEREQLQLIAGALKLGMILLLISSIALVLVNFIFVTPIQPALTSPYWSEMTIALVVITSSWALSRGKVKHWLGAASVFSGWWFLVFLTLGRSAPMSYGASLAIYVVFVALIAVILGYLRSWYPRGD